MRIFIKRLIPRQQTKGRPARAPSILPPTAENVALRLEVIVFMVDYTFLKELDMYALEFSQVSGLCFSSSVFFILLQTFCDI